MPAFSSMATSLATFMEAVARKQKADPPPRYGYQVDVEMGIGWYREEQTGCHVLEKPVVIPSGVPHYQGYKIFFAYCQKAGVRDVLEGHTPPVLPATEKEPTEFKSLEHISDNFGAKDPKAAAENSKYCVAFLVPGELATQAEVPGRNIWMVDLSKDKVSPFLQAAKAGDASKAKQRLAGGVSGDAVDEDGVSALMMAAFANSAETCQAILGSGASVDYAEPNQGRTALMFAAQGGHAEAASALLSAKAETSKVDSEGQTALHWAALAGKTEMAKSLLASGCPKDAKNKEGLTALQVAEKLGHTSTVAALK